MDNKKIASQFRLLADLMKITGESVFRIRSYEKAYEILRKVPGDLCSMSEEELLQLEGVGDAIAEKIIAICREGTMPQLDKLKAKIPPGVVDFLNIRGLGASKIRFLWLEQNIITIDDLYESLVDKTALKWKGFGEKTRQNFIKEIDFYRRSKGAMLWYQAMNVHIDLYEQLKDFAGKIEFTGELRRNMPVVNQIGWLVIDAGDEFYKRIEELGKVSKIKDDLYFELPSSKIPFIISECTSDDYEKSLFESIGGRLISENGLEWKGSEVKTFAEAGLSVIPPEMRDMKREDIPAEFNIDDLIAVEDIRGVIHAHTDWSDGRNSMEEMVDAAIEKGFEYLSITDHSKAAFYANGLSEDRIDMQVGAIEKLNRELDGFTVLTGVECDILTDGTLDLSNECLSQLDVVVASVHSNLGMSKNQATERLLAAIENPHVDILGHMSGRLLLTREGYELDYEQIIKACAENRVAIEINANPLRLDIDWEYIPLCREYGVPILINPDAHSIDQIDLIKYGVKVARKAGIRSSECLNTLSIKEFLHALHG